MIPVDNPHIVVTGSTGTGELHFGPGPEVLPLISSTETHPTFGPGPEVIPNTHHQTFHGFGPGPVVHDGVDLIGVSATAHFGLWA